MALQVEKRGCDDRAAIPAVISSLLSDNSRNLLINHYRQVSYCKA